MAYTTVNKGTDYFRVKLYTGNATNNTAITWDESDNMKPDWLWIKNRSIGQSHAIFDSTRGATKRFTSNGNGAETTENENLDSFDTNGFTVDYEAIVNGSGNDMVAWGWKCNGGTTSTNTDGSITSSVSANTTAGFSIVSYTGTGSNATVGHGLSSDVEMIIIKNRSQGDDWAVGSTKINFSNHLQLNTSNASTGAAAVFNSTAPTSSVFTVGTNHKTNASGENYIAYCFHSIKGYSKFGIYKANGNADGPFVYLGFKPAFHIVKRIDVANDWNMQDIKRTLNGEDKILQANNNNAENVGGGYKIDKLSNGFKCRESGTETNGSGGTYLYMAWAVAPLVGTNNVPATAR